MSRISFNRKRAKLKQLLGIRARLALLALILVAPLMLDRARSLEDTRSKQIALASREFADLAQHSADTQREVISSVETMLKSAAYIRASGGVGRSCEILRASLPLNLPWIRSIMIVSKDGLVQCSTLNNLVGLDLSDREYLKQARETGGFVFSDFLFAKSSKRPIMMAAYPVSAINREEDSIVVAGINLDWMSKIMSNLGSRPGVSAVLVDSAGVVLAAPADQTQPVDEEEASHDDQCQSPEQIVAHFRSALWRHVPLLLWSAGPCAGFDVRKIRHAVGNVPRFSANGREESVNDEADDR
jgi:hypothetical protein